MNPRLLAGTTALALVAAPLLTAPAVSAAPTRAAVVTLGMSGDQATVSQSVVRPGIVEFRVSGNFTVPGPGGGPEALTIVATSQLDQVLALLPAVFAGNPGDPASMAASAAAMRSIHAMTTFYGGSQKGGVWQVNLPVGDYYALGIQSAAMGLTKPVAFTVAGAPRASTLHATQAFVTATGPVGDNRWHVSQPGGHPVDWLRFSNHAHEIHFLDITSVKPMTTDAMVRKAFSSNSQRQPKWVNQPALNFDVISPGVTVAIDTINQKGPLPAGRYLVDCFIPSETDGMPHALMGMFELFDLR
jgi:hypothetical protein